MFKINDIYSVEAAQCIFVKKSENLKHYPTRSLEYISKTLEEQGQQNILIVTFHKDSK